MRPFDPNGGDPLEWRIEYTAWKLRVVEATTAQNQALAAYNVAQAKLAQLAGWRDQLTSALGDMSNRVGGYAAVNARLASLAQALSDLEGQLGDHLAARDTATSRLVTGPPTGQPLVLLPVRVHTAWQGSSLAVRILPSELSVDRHDPRLSPLETAQGQAYWATRSLPGDGQASQAWQDLTRRVPPQRAAWIVKATDPGAASPPLARAESLDAAVTVRLLPDRFAVVLLAKGEPVNVAPTGSPAQFISWGGEVPAELPVELLHAPGDRPWTTDLDAAVAAGMALRLTVPTTPSIDQLVVVGLRSSSGPGDLTDLLQHHVFGAGAELLPDGVLTNNSPADRSGRSSDHDKEALLELVTGAGAATCPPGSAGQQLADLLGIPATSVALVPGAQLPRRAVPEAVGQLVHAAATGAAATRFGATPASLAALVPGGPAPALRVGKQPFGILPAVEAGRWVAGSDAVDQQLAPAVHEIAQDHLLPLDVDPATPPPIAPLPRRVTRDDASALPAVLTESASSLSWSSASDPTQQWTGLDQLVGQATGPQAPATYLDQLAHGPRNKDVDAAAGASVLGSLALAASAIPGSSATLALLAASARDEPGRQALAAALGEHLDALSHRVDAWVTAAAFHRRTTACTGAPVVGAYGYLTNVAPRSIPRSFGHLHAPSLGHAATAAVLRSGYLGQRRTAWAALLAAAKTAGDIAGAARAQAGLSALSPLDPTAEGRLPMAIDLSSRRIRRARWILSAVRQGQPLAAVLGQQVERGLIEANLQGYLAAFRKLTRFSTGTELESLEAARRAAGDALDAELHTLTQLQTVATAAAGPVTQANAARDLAAAALASATPPYAPYAGLPTQIVDLQQQVDQDRAALTNLLAHPPGTTTHNTPVNVP